MTADHLLGLGVAEAGQRLVEQQDARLPGERARQLHQAQLACVVSSPARRCAIRGQADAGDRLGGEPARLRVGVGAHVGADHDVVGHRHARERPHDLEGAADAGRAQLVRLAADVMSRPSSRICPASGRRKPLSRLKAVVLPAPFGPMMPRIAPSRHVEADVLHRLQAAEALRQAAHRRGSAPCRRSAAAARAWQLSSRCRARQRCRNRVRRASRPDAASGDSTKSRAFQNMPSGATRMRIDDGDAVDDALDAGNDVAELGMQDLGRSGSGSPRRSPDPTPCRRRRTA